jgi:hypothetical protein
MTILRCINDNGVKYDLDLLEDIPFKLDISAIESGNIGQAFGVSSQKLVLPPSKNNNEFFGNLYDVGSTPSTSFIKTVPCQVLQNGTEIFTGKLYLESVVTDNQGNDVYNVVVVNETVDFGFLIKDKTFGDLDFSSLYHDYTYDNIKDSWSKTLLNGAVFYPLINYGFDVDSPTDTQIKSGGQPRTFTNYNSPLQVDDFKPAIRVRDALDIIFNSVGYEYTSSLFTSGSYTDDIYLLATEDDKKGISTINPVSQSFLAYTNANQDYTDTQAVSVVNFPVEFYDNAGQYSDPTFTADVNGNYQFGVNVQYEILNYNNVGDARFVTFKVYKNGAPFTVNGIAQDYTFDLTGLVNGTLQFSTLNYPLLANDEIEIWVVYTETASGTQTFRIKQSSQSRFQLLQGPTTNIGGQVDLAPVYRDISVSDFLSGLIEKFNLVIEPVRNQRNVLKIETFNDWVDQGGIVDWSDKVDYNQKWNISHPLQNQPKNIKFTDIEDNIALTQYHKRSTGKLYGEFDYISESDLAKGEKTIGKLFAPTPIKAIDGSKQMILPTLAEKDDSTQPFKRTKFAPRLVYHNGLQDVGDIISTNSTGLIASGRYWFKDESNVIHQETQYGLASHLQATPADFDSTRDLHFGNTYSPGHYNYHQAQFNGQTKRTAFNDYWAFYVNELYDVDSRLVTLNIFLDPTEIPQIQLNDKIFIDGHYYRINKIKGANVTREDSVEVELIKTLPRKLTFPRRRVELDDTVVDIVADDSTFGADGLITYNDFETGAIYTGSALTPAAQRDGFSTYGSTVVWNTLKPTSARFTSQTNIGLNTVDESAESIDTRGDNNTIANNVVTARVEGSDNVVQNSAKFVNITGTENTVEANADNVAIQQSTTSLISANTTLSTIIGGTDTIISGSNKSVVIGQDLTVQGGNSNIVVGNYDTQVKTVTDLINTVVINPNRDLESRENISGSDFSGRAYIGNYQDIGSRYSDNKNLTLSAGQTLYLTGSDYSSDAVYDVSWSGSDGTANIYLPEVDVNIASLAKGQGGYKRYLRFTTDGSIDAGKNVNVNVATGEYLNGDFNGFYNLDAPYQNFEIYGVSQSYWRVLEAGVPDITNGGHSGAYGSFYSSASQAIVTPGTPQLVTFNGTLSSNKVALSGSGAIQMEYNGAYKLTYTAQLTNIDNAYHYATFWIKYNGVDYPNSSVRVSAPPRKSASEPSSTAVTVGLLDVAQNDFDKIELYWVGDDTDLSLEYVAGVGIPDAPSVFAQINAV